ncbi:MULTISPECIES: helix-turn-helix domain-containing protein [unclassified Microcella]|uniref:helix-turn-helix domain-containing protein n=1 Tax=unclassified Microcella TaxID=2630066 RepID=UPI00138F807F|nr:MULTISPECIES: helix-turn-helix domain-containing protein [unclassified Microcella]
MTTSTLLLHPVRLRIVQAMLGREQITTRELAERLGDVAPATLYRHVAALVDGGVIEVVSETRVRGASERALRLNLSRASVDPHDEGLADDERARAGFLAYLASLAAAFDDYLAAPRSTLEEDLVGFRQVAVVATDDEWRAVAATIRDALLPLIERSEAPDGARRRILGTVSLPVD